MNRKAWVAVLVWLAAGSARAEDCPAVAGFRVESSSRIAPYAATAANRVRGRLMCNYWHPADDEQPRAILRAWWTTFAPRRPASGWCAGRDPSAREDYTVSVDQRAPRISAVGNHRDIELFLHLAKSEFQASRRAAWTDVIRRVMEDNAQRAISCRDGAPGMLAVEIVAEPPTGESTGPVEPVVAEPAAAPSSPAPVADPYGGDPEPAAAPSTALREDPYPANPTPAQPSAPVRPSTPSPAARPPEEAPSDEQISDIIEQLKRRQSGQ